MAPTAEPLRSPSGQQIIAQFLAPKALRGDTTTDPDLVADDVDVFSAESPAAIPFHPDSRTDDGEVWGYFFGDYPMDDVRLVPGGWWVRYGPEKEYVHGHGDAMEAVAFRRSFAFHATCSGDDGGVDVLPTLWLMNEYRLNKDAAAFRAVAKRPGPKANMDCVVRKIYSKSPPSPPASTEEEEEIQASRYVDEEAGYYSDEDWRRVGCRIEEESRRKSGPFYVV